jgi:hypothetical protein
MKNIIWLSAWCCFSMGVFSQGSSSRTNQFIDLTGTFGSSQGSVAGAYIYNWKLWKKQKFEIGIGARWTSYFGSKVDFYTAGPAKYTRSFTIPFLIFFAGQKEENFDTLTVQRPFTNSFNITANLGYHISSKWYAGFNIDVIGFTFGRKSAGIFKGDGNTLADPNTKPAGFNVLLTGDHDQGTLNSEFFITYKVASRWNIKAVYQFLFVEYKTGMVIQQIKDGPSNDRFRNKANNLGLGVTYSLSAL